MGKMDEVDPGLGDSLKDLLARLRQSTPTDPKADREVATVHARVAYAASELQARSSERIAGLTKWLVIATIVLATATIALVVSTLRLVDVTAGL